MIQPQRERVEVEAPSEHHGGPLQSVAWAVAGFLLGLCLALAGITFGIFLCAIPVLGWLAGPLIIVASLALPFVLASLLAVEGRFIVLVRNGKPPTGAGEAGEPRPVNGRSPTGLGTNGRRPPPALSNR
jgi:hypothetical protein